MSEHTAGPDRRVRVYVLGTLHLERRMPDGRWEEVPTTSEEWGSGHPTRSFLRYLLAHGRCVGRSMILETLWTDVDSADRYLYNAASTLRRILRSDEQAPLLETIYNRTTYKLADQSHVWVDVDHCTALLQDVKRSGPTSEHGLHLLQEAELLFRRGPLFADEPGDWCFGLREQTKTMQYRCQLWLAEAYEAHQQLAEAEIVVESLLIQDPTDERALRHLMTLLHKQGLTSEAMRRYKQTTAFLRQKEMVLSAETEAFAKKLHSETDVHAKHPLLLAMQESTSPDLWSEPTSQVMVVPPLLRQRVLTLPSSATYGETLSGMVQADSTTMFGIQLSRIVTLIQQWHGMAIFSHDLQCQLDQEIKALDGIIPHDDVSLFSRRSFLISLAALPATYLISVRQKHKLVLDLEELLSRCTASITACWHLSGGSHLEALEPILDSYLPTLVSVLKHAPVYREVTATLITQIYSLKAILAWHVEGLNRAETCCLQALQYSQVAKNANLRLTALNQHALILFYARNFKQALAKSEEADATLCKAAHEESIFPILHGRVCMYLAAFQAQQGDTIAAERTLERAYQGFDAQGASTGPIPLYADCASASLTLWDGWTHYFLGQHNAASKQRALTSLRTFGQMQPSHAVPERFRLECLNSRTVAAIQMNEMEEALACFKAGQQGAKQLGSMQRGAEIDYAYQAMLRAWPTEMHAFKRFEEA